MHVPAGTNLSDLLASPVTTDVAQAVAPRQPGVYAWWARPGVLAGISGGAHPAEAVELIYVGIARSSPTSHATLRSRVVGNHIRGTTGQSTLRRSLASLLWQSAGWRSTFTDRPMLVPADEQRLKRVDVGEPEADLGRSRGAPDGRGGRDRIAAATIEPVGEPLASAARPRPGGKEEMARRGTQVSGRVTPGSVGSRRLWSAGTRRGARG